MTSNAEFPCPSCGKSIELDVQVLLEGKRIVCPHCSTEFQIDTRSSSEAVRTRA